MGRLSLACRRVGVRPDGGLNDDSATDVVDAQRTRPRIDITDRWKFLDKGTTRGGFRSALTARGVKGWRLRARLSTILRKLHTYTRRCLCPRGRRRRSRKPLNGVTPRQSHHLSIVWAKPSKSTANRFCCLLPTSSLSSLSIHLSVAHFCFPFVLSCTSVLRSAFAHRRPKQANPLRVPAKGSTAFVDPPCATFNPVLQPHWPKEHPQGKDFNGSILASGLLSCTM